MFKIKTLSKNIYICDTTLRFKDDLSSLKKAKYKNLKIYEGGNHLDIIDDGVGSLGLLIIEDHFVK